MHMLFCKLCTIHNIASDLNKGSVNCWYFTVAQLIKHNVGIFSNYVRKAECWLKENYLFNLLNYAAFISFCDSHSS